MTFPHYDAPEEDDGTAFLRGLAYASVVCLGFWALVAWWVFA